MLAVTSKTNHAGPDRVNIRLFALMLFASAFAAPISWAADPIAQSPPQRAIGAGFQEGVFTTANPESWIAFFVGLGGWVVRDRAPLEQGLKKLWNLPDATSGQTILLANKNMDAGMVRLVTLTGISQEMIRADDRPWDSGGWFDLDVRVKNMPAIHKMLQTRGWQGDSPPIHYTFGPFEVVEWLARGPDGVRIAFIERINPPLTDWPPFDTISHAFNATTIVRDMKASRAFYEDALGMKPYRQSNEVSHAPEANVLGLPQNIATMVARDVAILHPQGTNAGSVELMQFVGATGSDLSPRTAPSNLGISALRFPIAKMDRFLSEMQAKGIRIEAGPVVMTVAPYGRINIAAITSPDGARLEFFEVIDQ